MDWTGRDTFLILLLIAIAVLLRLPRLAEPATIVFDEAYYAKDACLYTGISQQACNSPQATEQSYVHPPLGKWLLAIGIKLFGYTSFGWRISSAVFGAAMAPLAYLLTRKLFRERWIAFVAGLLVATDFLLIVQSRIAMLDIFESFFILVGFVFLAFDRDRLSLLRENALLPFPGAVSAREPEWRFAAGAAFGLAVAVKWSAVFALAGAGLMALAWIGGFVRSVGRTSDASSRGRILARELASAALALGLVPILVYLMSYSLWFKDNFGPRHCTDAPKPFCATGVVGTAVAFQELQESMWEYHKNLDATHGYQAQAWTWPLVARPIAYYYTGPPDTTKSHHILAFGNPAVWWAALGAAVWLLVRSLRKWRPERFVVAVWGFQYLPWLLTSIISAIATTADDPVRPLFFFYMTPIAPFMMVGTAAALGRLREIARPARVLVTAYLLIGLVGLLFYFYPILVGSGLSQDSWNGRMWFKAGCGQKPTATWCWI